MKLKAVSNHCYFGFAKSYAKCWWRRKPCTVKWWRTVDQNPINVMIDTGWKTMETQEEKFDCDSFRDYYARRESGHSISENENMRSSEHVETCISCSAFAKQHETIIETMASLPQFDVSEKLTQSILQSVYLSQPKKADLLLPIGAAAGVVFFALLPFDSIQGWLSWGVGLIGLCGLQVLLKSAERTESIS